MQVLRRARVWTVLFLIGVVALIVVSVIRDRRGGSAETVHDWVGVLCLAFALGVALVSVRNLVRRREPANVAAALLAPLGLAGILFVVISDLSQEGPSADIGGGGILILGFIAIVVAGFLSREAEFRD